MGSLGVTIKLLSRDWKVTGSSLGNRLLCKKQCKATLVGPFPGPISWLIARTKLRTHQEHKSLRTHQEHKSLPLKNKALAEHFLFVIEIEQAPCIFKIKWQQSRRFRSIPLWRTMFDLDHCNGQANNQTEV